MSQGSPAMAVGGRSSGVKTFSAIGPFGGFFSLTVALERLPPVLNGSWDRDRSIGTSKAVWGSRTATVGLGQNPGRNGSGRGRERERGRAERRKKNKKLGLA